MPDNSFKPKTPKVVATPPTAPAPTKATPPTYKGPYCPCTPNTAPADTIPAIPRHPGHTRHPTPNRATENPAKTPPATHITLQPDRKSQRLKPNHQCPPRLPSSAHKNKLTTTIHNSNTLVL